MILIGKHKEKLQFVEKRNIEGVLLDDAKKMSPEFDVVVEASGSESGFERLWICLNHAENWF